MAERKEPKDLKDHTEEELDHLLTKEDMIELAHEWAISSPLIPATPKNC